MSWFRQEWKFLAFGACNLLIMGLLVLLLRRPPAGAIQVLPPSPTATPPPTATPGPLHVYICGAVARPDVYALPAGSIVKDVLEAAGGPTDDADLVRVNLAQPLRDGDQVYVPALGGETSEAAIMPAPQLAYPPAATTVAPVIYPLDLNAATQEELETLPGIGPVLAERIMEYRPYLHVEEILDVPGIGPATFEKLRDKITVR